MNAKAEEGLQILRQKAAQGDLAPSTDLEKDLFPDLLDFINNLGKSNATVLLEKLRREAERTEEVRESLEQREKAARRLFFILLAPQEEDDDDGFSVEHINAIYEAITEEIES
jgi:hypothetical protein